MRKVIRKKVYDTENAEKVAEYCNGLSRSDEYYSHTTLYLTQRGQFFFHLEQGPYTKSSEGKIKWGLETICLASPKQVYKWLEEDNLIEEIEKYFPNEIEEG